MLKMQKSLKLSTFSELYDILLDKESFLCRFHDEVDMSFILNELKDKYCPDNGRQAIDPILLFKCLILKQITELSDVDLMEEIKVNMEYKYFLDMVPEELPPSPSTLCVFRRQRLKDSNMMDLLLNKSFEMALETGLIKPDSKDGKVHINVIIDGTHTESRNGLMLPVPALKLWSKKVRAALYKADESLSGIIKKDQSIGATDLEGELQYCQNLVKTIIEDLPEMAKIPFVRRRMNRLQEMINDINQYYYPSTSDPDARVGHKGEDTDFFGYKTQLAMDEDSRLLLGAEVTSGEVGDAIAGQPVIERLAQKEGVVIDEMLGDTAYSGQPFLELGTEYSFDVIAPPHPNLGKGIDGRDGFTFNKDADMFCCPQGHMAISKRTVTHKKDNYRKSTIYTFDSQICTICPLRQTCIKGKAKFRTFSVTQLTDQQKKLLKEKDTDYFRQRRPQRYKIEAKNAHLKQGFGMRYAFGKGIEMMTVQTAVAVFASNLKIILGIKTKK